ncbi:MAG: hypothetical protein ACI8W3_001444 [Myxococcota bacterium]|jgi:hypothetical protein
MQPRTTAILFVVAAALGAFVYLQEIDGAATRGEAEELSRRVFPELRASAIDWVSFRTQDERDFEARRIEGGWEIVSPVVFPGDSVNLDAVASTLANLTSEGTIDSPSKPEIYGLGAAARSISFRAGDQELVLGIGAETPVGGDIYVSRSTSETEVLTVPAFRVSSFDRDLDSLRDRRVLNFDRTSVRRVVVGWPEGAMTLAREGEHWAITHPANLVGRADTKAIDDLLSDVAFLRAEGFVDEDQHATEGDVAEPYYTLRLELEAGEGQPLEVGLRVMADRRGEDFLVRGGHLGALYRVPATRIDELPRNYFAYRFKELSNFEVALVHAFELEFARDGEESSLEPVRARVERADAGWKASGDPWVVGMAAGFVAEFARLEAMAIEAQRPSKDELAAAGLAPARVVMRAYDLGSEQVAPRVLSEVSLGELDPEFGIAARSTGQAALYRLDPALAEQIPTGLDAFNARFLAQASDEDTPSQ